MGLSVLEGTTVGSLLVEVVGIDAGEGDVVSDPAQKLQRDFLVTGEVLDHTLRTQLRSSVDLITYQDKDHIRRRSGAERRGRFVIKRVKTAKAGVAGHLAPSEWLWHGTPCFT